MQKGKIDKGEKDQRHHPRVPLDATAKVLFCGRHVSVVLSNISLGGVLFRCADFFSLGDIMTIIISGEHRGNVFNESLLGKIVTVYRQEGNNAYGLKFSTSLCAETYPVLTTFLMRRNQPRVSFLRDPQYKRAERKN